MLISDQFGFFNFNLPPMCAAWFYSH
jgi:hypothetical protein